MNWHVQLVPLFADRDTFRDLGGGFRGDHAKVDATELTIVVLALLGGAVVFWLLSRAATWREGRGSFHSPHQLFRRLCQAHGLNRRERRLLDQVCRVGRLTTSAEVFLRPQLFLDAKAQEEFRLQGGDLTQLHAKLFGDICAGNEKPQTAPCSPRALTELSKFV